MTDIKILQGQFEEAAKKFPGLRHTIAQQSKDGRDPETTACEYGDCSNPPDSDYYVYRWSEYIDRDPNEKGYPSWHFLSRPYPQVWSVRQAEGQALVLAEEAGKCLITLPELKGLKIDDSAERWFLALHRIYPCKKLTYDPPPSEFHPTMPRLKLSGTWREAKPGEAYIEELDNVFLKSAMICGKRLEEPAETGQDEIFIDLTLFYKGKSKDLLTSLILTPTGVQGTSQDVRNLRETLRDDKGEEYKRVAKSIQKKRKEDIICVDTKKITLKQKNIPT